MNLKTLLLINAIIFSVGFFAHLFRIVSNGRFVVLGIDIPLWASAVFVIIAGFLAYQNYTNSKKSA